MRSIIVVDVSRIADSCGYGVPFMSFEGHRPTMDQWSTRKGPEGIRKYWAEKNAKSLDQLDGLTDPLSARSAGSSGPARLPHGRRHKEVVLDTSH